MLDVLKTRRSVRKYTDEMPRDEDIERIVEAGLYAPTGMGRQGVKFVVVKNNAQFKKSVALGYLIQQKYHNDIRNTLP